MTGFAVHSSDLNSEILYSSGSITSSEERLESLVRFGDRPLDLLLDTGANRLFWTFRGKRTTKATRTGYFIAEYHDEADDLFRGLASQLEALHESDTWSVPYADDPRWDAGFSLWRMSPSYPGLSAAEQAALHEWLDREREHESALEFGMRDYHAAFQVLVAISRADLDCTVAIGADGDIGALGDVDLFLRVGDSPNFHPLSSSATALRTDHDTNAASGGQLQHAPPTPDRSTVEFVSRLSGAVLLLLLGFSLYSFFSVQPLHPITGLSTIGGLVGSILALSFVVPRVTPGYDSEGIVDTARTLLTRDTVWTLPIITGGTFAAFLFPTIFRVSGAALGDPWLLGVVTELRFALPSVAVFTLALLGMTIVLFRHLPQLSEWTMDNDLLEAIATSYGIYGSMLLIANGLAKALWFSVIPAM